MVLFSFIGGVVWGLVKVLRIERQIVAIKENDKFEFDTVHRQFENVYRTTGEIRDDSNQAMNNLWRDITTKFEKMEQYQEIRHDELSRTMNDMYNDSCRYTDRRIDKSLNQKEII
jgi:hypothetical protein